MYRVSLFSVLVVLACCQPATSPETVGSLESTLYGNILHCQWSRLNPLTPELGRMESLLSLENKTGFGDAFFMYRQEPEGVRRANLLLVRLYDSKYVDGHHTELRVPLSGYRPDLREWKDTAQVEVALYSGWRRLGTLNKTMSFTVREKHIELVVTPAEVLRLQEHLLFQLEYFPILYVTVLCVAAVLVELTSESTAKRLPALPAAILASKLLSRVVLCLTASFSAQQPYGGLLLLTGVVTTLLLVRYLDKFSRALNQKTTRGTSTFLVLVIFLELAFAYEWWYNLLGSLLPGLLLLANWGARSYRSQSSYVAVFLAHHVMALYYTLCDDNVFRIEPHPRAGAAMLALLALQLAGLKLQKWRVPLLRWIRRLKKAELVSGDCPICLQPLSETVLTTSCGHSFHQECLTTWVDVSSTCPLDRHQIDVNLL